MKLFELRVCHPDTWLVVCDSVTGVRELGCPFTNDGGGRGVRREGVSGEAGGEAYVDMG